MSCAVEMPDIYGSSALFVIDFLLKNTESHYHKKVIPAARRHAVLSKQSSSYVNFFLLTRRKMRQHEQ